MSEHITKSLLFAYKRLQDLVWLSIVIAGILIYRWESPTSQWIWIAGAIFVALIVLWIGYIILGTTFFGALGLLAVASEQKFIGIAVYVACWVFLFPAMVIASMGFGIYCREYKVLIPRDLKWIFNKPRGSWLVPNEDGIVKVSLPSGESFEVSGSDWYFIHPTQTQVNASLESETHPCLVQYKKHLHNKLKSVDFYYLKRRRDISPNTFFFLTALGKFSSEPSPVINEDVAQSIDNEIGLGEGVQVYWTRNIVEVTKNSVVRAFKTRTKKMSILGKEFSHYSEYFDLATITTTDWIISLECDDADALSSLRKAHEQIFESFRL